VDRISGKLIIWAYVLMMMAGCMNPIGGFSKSDDGEVSLIRVPDRLTIEMPPVKIHLNGGVEGVTKKMELLVGGTFVACVVICLAIFWGRVTVPRRDDLG